MRRVSTAPASAAACAIIAAVTVILIGSEGRLVAQEPVFPPINPDGLAPIELAGFGDPGNSRIVTQWFQGRLYAATERWSHCVFTAALAERFPLPVYPPPTGDCPPDPQDLTLAAEIWRYSPSTSSWEVVFTSPVDVPHPNDPTRLVPRDIGFTAMEVLVENDGSEALYVGGRSLAGVLGVASDHPPRLLRTVDGTTWNPVPQEPGSFLGDLGQGLPSGLVPTGFGELVALDGNLVALVTTRVGAGTLIASDDPAAGGDAWFEASGDPALPVSAVTAFNGRVYIGVGAPASGEAYAIYRSEGAGPPYFFDPVVVNDLPEGPGAKPVRALSFAEHGGRLYAGTAWPPELIRIDEDGTWELLVGSPRDSFEGEPLAPLSGISAGFGNTFNAQLSTMASDGASLYVGTLDGSFLTQFVPALQPMFLHEVGFDLLRSEDGIYWHPVSRFGLGAPTQVAVTSLEGTPLGLVAGTGGIGGAQVWLAGSAPPPGPIASPYRVESASAVLTNDEVILSWEPEAGAVLYAVYRSEVTPLRAALGGGAPSPLPGGGASSFLCDAAPELCLALEQFGTNVGLPGPFELRAVTSDPYYVEAPPTSLQSMYFVRAMRADGGLSGPSNVVGAASTAEPVTYPVLERELLALLESGEPTLAKLRALTLVRRSSYSASGGNMPAGRRMLELGELLVERERGVSIAATEADDICFMFYRLRRNLRLAEWLLIPVASLQ